MDRSFDYLPGCFARTFASVSHPFQTRNMHPSSLLGSDQNVRLSDHTNDYHRGFSDTRDARRNICAWHNRICHPLRVLLRVLYCFDLLRCLRNNLTSYCSPFDDSTAAHCVC